MYRSLLLVGMLCGLIGSLTKTFGQPTFKSQIFLTDDGLPSNTIGSCAMDSVGYLWISTRRGLCRFDGYVFRNYPIVTGTCVDMNTDKYGRLVIYHNNQGLYLFNPYNLQYSAISKSIFSDSNPNNDHYNNIYIDESDRIWCTDFNNLKYFTPRKYYTHSFTILPDNHITDRIARFIQPNPTEIWAAGINGLWIWHQEDNQIRRSSNPIFRKRSFSAGAIVGIDSVVLVAGNMLYLVKASTQKILQKKVISQRLFNPIIDIKTIILDCKKYIVSATRSKLYCSDVTMSKFAEIYSSDEWSNVFSSIFTAPNGQIWIASNHGLIRLSPNSSAIENLSLPTKEFSEDYIMSVLSASNVDLYIGTSGGHLFYSDRKAIRLLSLPFNAGINDIARYEGKLLLSTYSGLYSYEKGKCRKIALPPKYENAIIKKALVTSNGIWLLVNGLPVLVLDVKTLLPIDRVIDNRIFSSNNIWNDIIEDNNGQIFLAGWMPEGFGLAQYDGKTKSFIAISNRTKNEALFIGDYFNHIAKSANNKLLFSGYGGFNMIDTKGKVTKIVSVKDHPLISEHVEGIAEMKDGTIWFGTEEGIQVWNPKTDLVSLITTVNGLLHNNALYAFVPINDSVLAVGFNKSISFLKTNKLFKSSLNNKLVLSEIKVNGKDTIFRHDSIVISPEQRNLTLRFSSLSFSNNRTICYWYRINKGEWQTLGNIPTLTFSNFKDGRYVLEVRASDNMQHMQTRHLTIAILALPFYYETVWFKILIVLLVIALIFSFFWYRILQLKKWSRFRMALSQDLHDDAGATLSSVHILSSILSENESLSSNGSLYLHRIVEDVKILQLKLDEIIWSLKSETASLQQIYLRLLEYGSYIFLAKNIFFKHTLTTTLEEVSFPIKTSRNLFLIGKEILNNIAKHSDATEANLDIYFMGKDIAVCIKDNGKGFSVTNKNERNGLSSIEKRISEIGADMKIESNSKGTTTSIILKSSKI